VRGGGSNLFKMTSIQEITQIYFKIKKYASPGWMLNILIKLFMKSFTHICCFTKLIELQRNNFEIVAVQYPFLLHLGRRMSHLNIKMNFLFFHWNSESSAIGTQKARSFLISNFFEQYLQTIVTMISQQSLSFVTR